MIQSPIRRVLSSMDAHDVRALLMGGQACVFYGAAEFSRDADFAILASPANLARLKRALEDLQAGVIAVPPFEVRFLKRGHAVHFRCRHPEASGIRIDVMTRMRGVDPFSKLWARRTTVELPDRTRCELMALEDLVCAKKTQRDKDWPMLRRLAEAHYFEHRDGASASQVSFWLQELRTTDLLVEVAERWPESAAQEARKRPLLAPACEKNTEAVSAALLEEERREREADARYWAPLRAELEALRHGCPGSRNPRSEA